MLSRPPIDSGLSPRGRGNLDTGGRAVTPGGSIPAWAGEPPRSSRERRSGWVYPRVGGGTSSIASCCPSAAGLSPRGRGLNWGSIRAPDELVDEGHLNDRGFWVEVPHPELDRSFKYPGPAGIYNGSPWRISRRAPLIGEHNEEIYCGELGLQRTELAYLAESGVV